VVAAQAVLTNGENMSKTIRANRRKPGSTKPAAANKKLRSKTTTAAPATDATRSDSKLAILITLLSHKDGASIEQMMGSTQWQAHSVRGAMSGALKKKRGLEIASAKIDGVRMYRIVA
jgi:hypothetical protein